jgi:hypothetical protein
MSSEQKVVATQANQANFEVKNSEVKSASKPKNEKTEEQIDYREDVISLKDIVEMADAVNSLLPPTSNGSEFGDNNAKNDGPRMGAFVTIQLFKALYAKSDERWNAIKDKVKIGIIKETKKYGNTSVSMGVAKLMSVYMPDKQYFIFLNCGTGGIKYQVYMHKNGILSLLFEHKPTSEAGPNALCVGAYKPSKKTHALDQNRLLIDQELKQVYKMGLDEYGIDLTGTPVFAFVTGDIRAEFEKAKEANTRKLYQDEVSNLFKGLAEPFNFNSYFMMQHEEGHNELVGTQTMYANLAMSGLLPSTTKVTTSFGIGKGSCQWTMSKENGMTEIIGVNVGMNKLQELSTAGTAIVEELWRKPAALNFFLESMSCTDCPIIAIKSGASLLLENNEVFRSGFKKLFETTTVSKRKLEQMQSENDQFRKKIAELEQFILSQNSEVEGYRYEQQQLAVGLQNLFSSFGRNMKVVPSVNVNLHT